MKAIIEISKRGDIFDAARKDVAAGRSRNFHLSFESARMLFSELTLARFDLLDTLRGIGPCSVYALAKAAKHNYSNVHTDIERLLQLGLIERTGDNRVRVPFTAIEVRLPFPLSA